MDIKDLAGLEKPLTKLIETISNGIGVAGNAAFQFDAKKIKRVGKAEAEVEKEKIIKIAEGNTIALEIQNRAEMRVKLVQYQEQVNLENIFAESKNLLEGKTVSEKPVDRDWSMRFVETAKGVSREDIQKMFAKVLAQEVISPDSYSLNTLEFLKNLTKKELIFIKRFLILADDYRKYVFMDKENGNEGFFEFSYDYLMKLIEMGILRASTSTHTKQNLQVNSKLEMKIFNEIVSFNSIVDNTHLRLGIMQLTQVGTELFSILEINQEDKEFQKRYITSLVEFLKSKSLEISPHLTQQ
jgi:Protein of unknown function (DUF2806)